MEREVNRSRQRVQRLVLLGIASLVVIGLVAWLATRDRPVVAETSPVDSSRPETPPVSISHDGSPSKSSSSAPSEPVVNLSLVPPLNVTAPVPSSASNSRELPRFPVTCQVQVDPGGDLSQRAADNPGKTLCLSAGVYTLAGPLRLAKGQTLASAPGQTAVLSGGKAVTGWSYDAATRLWKAQVPVVDRDGDQAQCEDDTHNLCRIRNQLFVAGKHLRWVPSKDRVGASSAYLDEATKVAYVGVDPTGKNMVYSVTDKAIDTSAANVTISNITVEYFATPAQFGAIAVGPRSVIQGVESRFNHGAGAKLAYAEGSVVRSNYFHDNGQLGLTQYQSNNVTITANVVDNNNTDGFWVADWESGGIKITESSGKVTNNTVTGNKGVGVWCDIAVHDMTIEGNTITNNGADGIRYEISRSGTITRNVLKGNGRGMGRGMGKSLWDGGGITVNTSSDLQIVDNTLEGNLHGVSLQARNRGEGPWGSYQFGNVKVTGNTFRLTGGEITGFVWEDGLEGRGSTVTFVGNTYTTHSGTHWQWGGEAMSYSQWSASHERS